MPYYRTIREKNVPSGSGAITSNLQTDLFYEKLGYRSHPPKDGIVSLVPGKQAEPWSWLDDSNAIKQRGYSSAHPELASLFKKDKGHPWDLTTCEFIGSPASFSVRQSGITTVYSNLRPFGSTTGSMKPLIPLGTDVALSNYAALEYGRTAPTSDQISMSAIIGELREGLPSLIPAFLTLGSKRAFKSTLKRQTRRAADAGSDYLNVQFGWIPMLSDVRKIATALAVATAAISGNSASTHRRRHMQEKDATISGTSTSFTWYLRHASPVVVGTSDEFVSFGRNIISCNNWFVQRHEVDYSFEAEFVRLPEGQKDYSSYLTRLDELMRWDITPMDLWQLAPWSWLVDWFFDIGGQLDAWNSATSNRILSLYAYGMRDERLTTTCIISDITPGSGITYTGPKVCFSQIKTRRRQRIKANPFGYTLDPLSSLSVGQIAILGALGLTKARR